MLHHTSLKIIIFQLSKFPIPTSLSQDQKRREPRKKNIPSRQTAKNIHTNRRPMRRPIIWRGMMITERNACVHN
jgi:hypothetical protein